MAKIAGVKLNNFPKIYEYLQGNLDVNLNDIVIVEGPLEAIEWGKVVYINKEGKEEKLKKILRKANNKDLEYIQKIEKNKPALMKKCEKLIKKHNLPMKLVGCSFSLDGKKIVFYFTSEIRVDFRNLVLDLVKEFKMQVRLQQISYRDEAIYFPFYYGICGQPICCARFLREVGGVNIDSAKIQDLSSLGIAKITGVCGRLMCCLKYEEMLYKKALRKMPKINSRVLTPKGEGKVVSFNIVKNQVGVELDDGVVLNFNADEIKKSK